VKKKTVNYLSKMLTDLESFTPFKEKKKEDTRKKIEEKEKEKE
jgi:hypothetical protein